MLFIVGNGKSDVGIRTEYVTVFRWLLTLLGFFLEKSIEGNFDSSEDPFDFFEDELFVLLTDRCDC